MFRLNYGNGQVSNSIDNLREAQHALRCQQEYSTRIKESDKTYIQKYTGDGEWEKVR